MLSIKKAIKKLLNSSTGFYDVFFRAITKDESKFRKEIIDLAKLKGNEKILDVGCGTGTLCLEIAKKHSGKINGIDISPNMIKKARKKAEKIKIKFQIGCGTELPFKANSYNVVFSTLVTHLMTDGEKDKTIKEIKRVLKKNGRYVSIEWGNFGYDRKLLKKNGFKIEHELKKPASIHFRGPTRKFTTVCRIAKKVDS